MLSPLGLELFSEISNLKLDNESTDESSDDSSDEEEEVSEFTEEEMVDFYFLSRYLL